MLIRRILAVTILGCIVALTACGSSSDDTAEPAETDLNPSPGGTLGGPNGGAGEGGDPVVVNYPASDDCSVDGQKQWVEASMRDYYLFASEVPTVNRADYATAADLAKALRVKPYDAFSYLSEIGTSNAFFEEGKSFGFGYSWKRDDDGAARISRTYAAAPFGLAGIKRSDIIVSMNGLAWNDIDGAKYNELVGTQEAPKVVTWEFEDGDDGSRIVAEMTHAEYKLDTVSFYQTLTNPNYTGHVGYMVFNSFLETSDAELDVAMDFFREREIGDLILDLRYNGGGRTRVARKLASQIAGPGTDDNLLIQYRYNNKYTDRNFKRYFENEPLNLGLNRVIVLTTERTASSSEIVINSLKPYIDVITIGEKTTGKPYITRGNDRCDERLNALEAEGFNQADVSVYGGIAPSCASKDDLTKDFGVADGSSGIEGMLLDALNYVIDATCVAPTLVAGTRGLLENSKSEPPHEFEPGGALID